MPIAIATAHPSPVITLVPDNRAGDGTWRWLVGVDDFVVLFLVVIH